MNQSGSLEDKKKTKISNMIDEVNDIANQLDLKMRKNQTYTEETQEKKEKDERESF